VELRDFDQITGGSVTAFSQEMMPEPAVRSRQSTTALPSALRAVARIGHGIRAKRRRE
jgi:hypothetical protein